MDQNINNQIPVPKPPKFQKIENNQISEQSENVMKSLEPPVSDLKFKKWIKLIFIGIGVIFGLLVFFSWLGYKDIFYLGEHLPNIDVSNEQFYYFFIFLAIMSLGVSIFLIGNSMFNKKASYSNSWEVIVFALFLIIVFVFIFNQFLSPFFR